MPVLGGLRQVAAELLQRLVRALGILRRDMPSAADRLDPGEDVLARDRLERQEQVLARDVVVAEVAPLVVGLVEQPREGSRDGGLLLAALDRGERCEPPLRLRAQSLPGAEQLLVEQRREQVIGDDLRVAAPARDLLRCRDGLLALDCQLVEIHGQFRLAGGWGCVGR